MDNKALINTLRDNAELTWASYGYFHLRGKKFEKEVVEKFYRNDKQ